jgi:hypothetical protein
MDILILILCAEPMKMFSGWEDFKFYLTFLNVISMVRYSNLAMVTGFISTPTITVKTLT